MSLNKQTILSQTADGETQAKAEVNPTREKLTLFYWSRLVYKTQYLWYLSYVFFIWKISTTIKKQNLISTQKSRWWAEMERFRRSLRAWNKPKWVSCSTSCCCSVELPQLHFHQVTSSRVLRWHPAEVLLQVYAWHKEPTAYMNHHTLAIYLWEPGGVWEVLNYVFDGYERLPFSSSFTQKQKKKTWKNKTVCAATAALWYPLCRTDALKWALVWGIHGPPRRLSQILWRPQALLLLFQLLWIPLARQLIGGNNKLGSLQPLANTSLADEEREDLTWSHVWGWISCACMHRHRCSAADCFRGDSGTNACVISPRGGSPATVNLLLSWGATENAWNQFCVCLKSSQPQQFENRGDLWWPLCVYIFPCRGIEWAQIDFADCFRWISGHNFSMLMTILSHMFKPWSVLMKVRWKKYISI